MLKYIMSIVIFIQMYNLISGNKLKKSQKCNAIQRGDFVRYSWTDGKTYHGKVVLQTCPNLLDT